MKLEIAILTAGLSLAATASAGPTEPKKPATAPAAAPADGSPEGRLLAGEFQKKGLYREDKKGFVDAELDALLKKYAQPNGVDSTELVGTTGATASGGGDLEQGVREGMPKWLGVFQKAAASATSWGPKQQAESRLMGAFYYRFFRKLYARHNAENASDQWAMPASVEYFLQHLGKSLSSKQQKTSNGNGAADFKTIGGGGPNYCAAASSKALQYGLANYGYKMGPQGYAREHGFKMLKAFMPSSAKGYQLRPGDVCSIRSAAGPKTGHVLTVAVPIQMDSLNSGTMWVVSGNAMLNSVSVDFQTVERPKGDRPTPGKIMILNCTTNSDVHFAHWKKEDLSKFKVTKTSDVESPDYPTAQSEKTAQK